VANSGVITALDGAASQYVRGDGTLADFPTSSGGGSSVSYYLNSSVSQGTIGGVAYRELSKEPIIGAGTDIAISTTGYVASYLTDANDPDVLSIPGGNFNCEFYFSVNNNTGDPFFYAELYKYDGSTFTLLGSSVGVPEYINQGTIIAPYYFAIPVATAALALTDRLAIRIYVNVDGRTVTLHTENGHLCQVVTTLSKGMVSLNNLTDQSQFITTGTSGTNFAIVSSGDTHTFNLPVASATNTGKLSSTDWSTFNNKVPYTGATASVDLGTNSLFAYDLFANGNGTNNANLYLKQGTASLLIQNGYSNILATGTKIGFQVATSAIAAYYADFQFSSLTAQRTFTLPDLSGTLALLEGTQTFSGYKTFSNGLVASVLQSTSGIILSTTIQVTPSSPSIAICGTPTGLEYRTATNVNSLVFQAANYTYTFPAATGTLALTSNLSAYLPLTGGTLTGPLNGTSAFFSSPSATFLSSGVNNIISTQTISIPNNSTWSNGSTFSASNNSQILSFAGSQLISNGSVVAGTVNVNRIQFTASSSIIALTQAVGIRALAGMQMLQQTGGTINGTISHGASMMVQGVYASGSANVTFTNYYGILINPINEFSGTTYGTRYGIYQAGSSDLNFFAGATTLGSALSGTSATFTNSGANNYLGIFASGTFDSGVTLGNGTTNKWYLYKGNDDRFEIYSVGKTGGAGAVMQISYTGAATFSSNVGIGVTPSAANLPSIESQYGFFSGQSEINLTTNAYYNSGFKYISSGSPALRYHQSTFDGSHQWFTSASGTAGAAISFSERMRITSAGNTQPGTDNAYSLGVSGTRWSAVWAANGTIQTSDEREKKDIIDADLGLDFISKLRPVSFKWKVGQNIVTSEVVKDEEGNPILDEEGNEKTESVIVPREGKRTHYGLIAQEVEELLDGKDFGGFIHDEETDTKGLRYDQFIPLLIKSIQELEAKIVTLESKLN
jgi:hypothetical protein